jgi:tripartite-type tricarboxylate transporter receptor subunit TctC
VPGMREAGIVDFDLPAFFGIWGPSGIPSPIVEKLAQATKTIWNKEDKRRALAAQAIQPFTASPQEFAQFVTEETAKWGRVIRMAKIEPQ